MAITGRRIHNEVIAYQLRQSFKPGEVTPEEANRIGYELASRFLKSEHAFLVATHNDRRHVHNHIVFCATALDCTRKFRDILRSGKVLAELSDQICEEHQLSVIREPENQTVTYDKWLGENAKASQRDMLRMTIDAALRMQPDIDAHKEAQAVYSAAGGKLPTLSELSEEYDLLLSQKKQAGEQLSHLNDELKNLRHIKLNMDTLLDDERFEEGQTQRMRDAEPEHEQHTTGKDR